MKSILDDGFQAYLTEGAAFVGEARIPLLMDLRNAQIPKDMIPFKAAMSATNFRQYVHFYMYDKEFSRVLTATRRYLPLLQKFDGVITPDCSMMIGQAPLPATDEHLHEPYGRLLSSEARHSRDSEHPMERQVQLLLLLPRRAARQHGRGEHAWMHPIAAGKSHVPHRP